MTCGTAGYQKFTKLWLNCTVWGHKNEFKQKLLFIPLLWHAPNVDFTQASRCEIVFLLWHHEPSRIFLLVDAGVDPLKWPLAAYELLPARLTCFICWLCQKLYTWLAITAVGYCVDPSKTMLNYHSPFLDSNQTKQFHKNMCGCFCWQWYELCIYNVTVIL